MRWLVSFTSRLPHPYYTQGSMSPRIGLEIQRRGTHLACQEYKHDSSDVNPKDIITTPTELSQYQFRIDTVSQFPLSNESNRTVQPLLQALNNQQVLGSCPVFCPVTAGIMKVLSKRPMNAVRELRTLCCVYTVSRDRASRSTPLSLAVNFNRIQSRHNKGRLSSPAVTEKERASHTAIKYSCRGQ